MIKPAPLLHLVMQAPKSFVTITLSDKVVKFLQFHLDQHETKLVLDKKSAFGRFIISMIRVHSYQHTEVGNVAFAFGKRAVKHLFRAENDVYKSCLYIPKKYQNDINLFFSKYINHEFCLRYSAVKENETILNYVIKFKDMYGFTDQDISDFALIKAWDRYKNRKRLDYVTS